MLRDVSKTPRVGLSPCKCKCVTKGVICEGGRSNPTETGVQTAVPWSDRVLEKSSEAMLSSGPRNSMCSGLSSDSESPGKEGRWRTLFWRMTVLRRVGEVNTHALGV